VLLQKRDFEPFKGELSLMGGFVQEDQCLRETAFRILEERTGLKDVYIHQVGAFGDVDRDPGARVISVAYYALVDKSLCNTQLNEKNFGFWCDIDKIPQLNFGHNNMVHDAIEQLRVHIGHLPIGFNLLPPMFTLSQLQNLYEAILGETIDKRNFRKRVAEMQSIESTGLIDKKSSKRGAVLYRFNKDKYEASGSFKL